MGLLDSLVRGLLRVLCGPPAPQAPPDGDVYVPPTVPHKPSGQRPPTSPPPSYHSRPDAAPPVARPPPPHGQQAHSPSPPRVDQNQVNQANPRYTALRARANEAGDQMARAFEASHQAYASGDGAGAKELSNQGKRHQAEMERLNREASEWIYVENNKDSARGEVDLHGLYVKEAIAYTDRAINEAKARGDTEVHLIVGKGLHSKSGTAKIKPAIEDLMRKHQLVAELDPHNAGVLIVSLDGHDRGGSVVQPDELARGIQGEGDRCVIM